METRESHHKTIAPVDNSILTGLNDRITLLEADVHHLFNEIQRYKRTIRARDQRIRSLELEDTFELYGSTAS